MNNITISFDQEQYFKKIEFEEDITLTLGQRRWYCHQQSILGDKVKQEYPSTVSEAFLASSDAFYFAQAIATMYDEGRALNINPYDALLPVYIAMDIGLNDLTIMIFFQLCHGEIRIIDYYEDKDKDVPFYANFLLQDKKYLYHTIFLPHDSTKRDYLDINNSYERDFKRLFSHTGTRFHVLKKMDKQLQISHAKISLSRCVFNLARTKKLIDNIAKYRKTWHEATGRYLADPYHNLASNYADAFQYTCQGVSHLETAGNMQGALQAHKQVVENRYKRII